MQSRNRMEQYWSRGVWVSMISSVICGVAGAQGLNDYNIIAYFDAKGTPVESRSKSVYYRKLLNVLNGCLYIQDFYSSNNAKQVDPVCITEEKDLRAWNIDSAHGLYRFWDRNGKKTEEVFIKHGMADGKYIAWDNQGKVKLRGHLVQGKREGTWYEYRADLSEPEISEWKNNYAILSYFTKNEQQTNDKKDAYYYRVLIDTPTALNPGYLVQDFYYGTHRKQTNPYRLLNAADLSKWTVKSLDGRIVFWTKYGQKEAVENYSKGVLNGYMAYWNEHGIKMVAGSFRHGTRVGTWSTWYKNGQVRSREVFFDGAEQRRKRTTWYQGGQISEEEHFKMRADSKSVRSGAYKTWYANGQRKQLSYYGNQGELLSSEFWQCNGEKIIMPAAKVKQETAMEIEKPEDNKAIQGIDTRMMKETEQPETDETAVDAGQARTKNSDHVVAPETDPKATQSTILIEEASTPEVP